MKTNQNVTTQRRRNIARQAQKEHYKSAVKNLLKAVDRVADELVAGKTGWDGKDAVKAVLLD
jgi:2-methylcitrate dehydratase PrpD